MNFFKFEIAVSLADDSFIFTTRERSEPLSVPAYIAVARGTDRVLSVGAEAKNMLGRAPANIDVSKVVWNGRSIDPELASAVMRHSIQSLRTGLIVPRPTMLIAVRSDGVARSLAKTMAQSAGAREIHLIDVAMATAIGMQLNVMEPDLKAVLTISEDWFEFAVISLSGIVTQIGGDFGAETFVEDIQNHLSLARQFRPEANAVGAQLMAKGIEPSAVVDIPGWEVWRGRSETGRFGMESISKEEISIGLAPSFYRIVERIKTAIRRLTPEQQYQLLRNGIRGTGSAMRIPGLPEAFARNLGCAVVANRTEIHPSIEGAKRGLDEIKFLKAVATSDTRFGAGGEVRR